jgi:hypothetical protein
MAQVLLSDVIEDQHGSKSTPRCSEDDRLAVSEAGYGHPDCHLTEASIKRPVGERSDRATEPINETVGIPATRFSQRQCP